MTTEDLIKKLNSDRVKAKRRFIASEENRELRRLHDGKHEDFNEKTFLFIKATDTDDGSRPLAPGTVFWNSPDIELFDSDGNLLPANELKQGQRYTIEVTVSNEGDMSSNSCVVELFICNPSIGFGVQYATSIGIQNVQVLGHNRTPVLFDFTPDASNVGHQCLFARAYSYTSGDMPNSWNSFSPNTDHHVGQQNTNIVAQGDTFEFQIVSIFGDEFHGQVRLHINQNRNLTVLARNALQVMGLTPINRNISSKKFAVLKNKELVAAVPTAHVAGPAVLARRPAPTNVFSRFLRTMFRTTRDIDSTKFERINAVNETTWAHTLSSGVNKVTLDVPFIFARSRSASVFDIEATDQETGESLGGITLIVKGK